MEYKHELERRRQNIGEEIGAAPLILSAHGAQQRAADMAHRFIQEASFLWLTGIEEPDWIAVLVDNELTLIAPKRNDVQQLFDGGLSDDEALAISGARRIIKNENARVYLEGLASEWREVYTLGNDPHAKYYRFEENNAPQVLRRQLTKLFDVVHDARPIFAKLRAIKSTYEIAEIQAAIDASIQGFTQLRQSLHKGAVYEYELEAVLNSTFRSTGAAGHAYDPIVAGGVHACTLHYVTNNSLLPRNGLVLIDAGANNGGYAADITRTYAVGTPSKRQREIHAAVQTAHYRIIELIRPGLMLKEYQQRVDDIMKDALKSVGLLTDTKDETTYRQYFPHAISHGLGLDVHESLGGYGEFMPGMVLTVEPGIYIPEEGIGVRIEDDILVTKDGNVNLSAALSTDL